LLGILSAVTTVSLVTVDLPADSTIRNQHEVIELSQKSAGDSILTAALRFLVNQYRMAMVVSRCTESVVLFFGATAYLLPILVARLSGKSVVLEPRGDVPLTLQLQWNQRLPSPIARLLARLVWMLERIGYHLATDIITYTPAMAAELGLDEFDSKLHPNGARYVDIDRFSMTTPLADRNRVVGFVGRVDEEKGVRKLAATAKRLPDDISFRFVGDGPLREELEATVSDDPRVEFAGWVDHDDVPAELNRMQLLVLPSQPTEGLPTTILEALACGTPVMATPVSGVPDVVRPGETGFLLSADDPESLATDIEAVLNRDIDAISQTGRQLIESNYSFEAAVGRYRTILRSLR
jgi:glycosyltransferase involved in cell wall biosynthesis